MQAPFSPKLNHCLICRFHFDCNGEGLRFATDKLDSKNFYACNPSFDKNCGC